MSAATSATTQPVHPPTVPDQEADRYEGIQQYSLKKIMAVWAAAAVPMGVLAWVVAPLLKDQFSGPEPLIQSALVCLTAGLAWQFVLVLILLRQEIGSFEWPRVRDALWLRPPRDSKTGRVGGKVWWWALPFLLGFAGPRTTRTGGRSNSLTRTRRTARSAPQRRLPAVLHPARGTAAASPWGSVASRDRAVRLCRR